MNAADIIAMLGLQPHPEGGWYRETWRGPTDATGRASGTAIYFLLCAGERSQWHRIDAVETWLFHAGASLTLSVAVDGEVTTHRLGVDLTAGERPQAVVPQGAWQSAETLGDFTLVSCVVTPGFKFDGFELAPPNWSPDRDVS
jgi:predicted cupin superfamily sugar epimerase